MFIDVAGFEARKGQMLDASLVQKPKTRKPALTRQQAAHRDVEANWTQKHDRSYFGYKNHINADVEHGIIRDYAVTPAAVHDSQALPDLLDITAARPAAVRRLSLPLGSHGATPQGSSPDPPCHAQSAAQPAADGSTKAH